MTQRRHCKVAQSLVYRAVFSKEICVKKNEGKEKKVVYCKGPSPWPNINKPNCEKTNVKLT